MGTQRDMMRETTDRTGFVLPSEDGWAAFAYLESGGSEYVWHASTKEEALAFFPRIVEVGLHRWGTHGCPRTLTAVVDHHGKVQRYDVSQEPCGTCESQTGGGTLWTGAAIAAIENGLV